MITLLETDDITAARVVSDNPEIITTLHNYFVLTEKQFYNNKIRFKKTSKINLLGRFNIGLTKDIILFLINFLKINYNNIIVSDKLKELLSITLFHDIKIPIIKFSEIVYKPEQQEAIRKALDASRGLIILPCGFGKSLVVAGIIESILNCQELFTKNIINNNSKAIIFVPTKQLVNQTYTEFIKTYKISPEKITMFTAGFNYSNNAKIIITNQQYYNKNYNKILHNDINILIFDEVHSLKKNNISTKFIRHFKNAKFLFGLSATLPKEEKDKYNLLKIGPVLYQKEYSELETINNTNNKLQINLYDITYNINNKKEIIRRIKSDLVEKEIVRLGDKYQLECSYTLTDEGIIYQTIKNIFVDKLENISNTLFLFDFLATEDKIKNIIDTNFSELKNKYDINYIDGRTDISLREKIREKFNNQNNIILFAQSQTLGVGINIPRLINLILFSIQSSNVKFIQAVGRLLRRVDNKDVVNIYDIHTNMNYSTNHYNKRLLLYKNYFNIKNIKSICSDIDIKIENRLFK